MLSSVCELTDAQAMENPNSALAAGPKPQFTSRFSDPSHPANSGSLAALISGGAVQMPQRNDMLSGRGGRAGGSRMDDRAVSRRGFGGPAVHGGAQTDTESRVQRGLGGLRGGRGSSNAGPLGLVQKIMKKVSVVLAH
jgi:hypothetical protein